MLSESDVKISQIIFGLLRQATTQAVVKDFLKKNGVSVSAKNWDELFTLRVQPALHDGSISLDGLRGLLQDYEECSRQHVFLYSCSPNKARGLIDRKRVVAVAEGVGLGHVIDAPLDLDMPESPTVVEIRFVSPADPGGLGGLLIKIVETRVTSVLVDERSDFEAGKLTKEYRLNKKRALNLAYLREDGLLQLRVASQDNRTRYHDNVIALKYLISDIIPMDGFSPVSISKAKDVVLRGRKSLMGDIRYSNSSAKNAFGCLLNLASSSQNDNLSDDDGSMAAFDTFLEKDGEVTAANVYLKIKDSQDDREVHVMLSGDINEFAIPVSCSTGEFDYVCRKILAFNS